jgi:hypothetical protein
LVFKLFAAFAAIPRHAFGVIWHFVIRKCGFWCKRLVALIAKNVFFSLIVLAELMLLIGLIVDELPLANVAPWNGVRVLLLAMLEKWRILLKTQIAVSALKLFDVGVRGEMRD